MDGSLAEASTTVLDAAATVAADRPLPGLRAWFVGYLAWLGGLALLALTMLSRYEHGDAGALRFWALALMGFYLSLCNVLLPLPTTWIILLVASPEVALFEAIWLRVLVIAALGAVATTAANLNEYHVLAFLLRYGLGRRIRATRVYHWAIRWFDVAPFQTLALIGFLPIPIDAIRWLAILRLYSRLRFALAYLVGRGTRYLIFAGFSVFMQLTGWQILFIQVAILAATLLGRLLWRVIKRGGTSHALADAGPPGQAD